jgi:hypothetical protein
MMISIPASMGCVNQKNKYDHKALKCQLNGKGTPSFPYYLFFKIYSRSHTNPAATPSSHTTYLTRVQNQLGGLKLGLIKLGTKSRCFRELPFRINNQSP